jgi:hypothetical protein
MWFLTCNSAERCVEVEAASCKAWCEIPTTAQIKMLVAQTAKRDRVVVKVVVLLTMLWLTLRKTSVLRLAWTSPEEVEVGASRLSVNSE